VPAASRYNEKNGRNEDSAGDQLLPIARYAQKPEIAGTKQGDVSDFFLFSFAR
jgi:hypothetical protein